MKNGDIVSGIRIDNGEKVIGELHIWRKYRPTAIITEPHHERISDGYEVDPFKIELIH